MPNGRDANWIRICAAVDGFRGRYGTWPKSVRVPFGVLEDLKRLFGADFSKVTEKVDFMADEVPIFAEGEQGATYSYGKEGFPSGVRRPF